MSNNIPASKREPDEAALAKAYSLLSSDPQRALTELTRLATMGSIASMLHIGQAHRRGVGVKENLEEAEKWFRRAADEGSLTGHYILGRIYLTQHRDHDAALVLETAAERRYVPAIHLLGRMYLEGKGVVQDAQKGEALLRRAMNGGSILARGKLGHVLLQHGRLRQKVEGLIYLIQSFFEVIFELSTKGNSSERLK